MSGDVQLELYLHEYKMTALSSVLEEQGSSVEERMQEMLIDLYSELVPYEVQQEIRTRIDAEHAAEKAAIEAARQYTAFCVRASGKDQFFQSEARGKFPGDWEISAAVFAERTRTWNCGVEKSIPGSDADL